MITSEGGSFRYSGGENTSLNPTAQTVVSAINRRAATANAAPWVLAGGVFAGILLFGEPLLAITVIAVAATSAAILNRKCQHRRQTLLRYHLDEAGQKVCTTLERGVSALSAANATWRVNPESPAIGRTASTAGTPGMRFIKSNMPIPGIVAGSDTLHFLPDQLLIRSRKEYVSVGYNQVAVETTAVDIIETSWVPSDAATVGRTWKHAKRDGGPDRRYRDNPAFPIVRYALVTLKMDHYQWGLLVSSAARAEAFASAVRNTTVPAVMQARALPEVAAVAMPPALPVVRNAPQSEPRFVPPPVPAVIPEISRVSEPSRWIPAGQTVTIAGFEIPGMVYFGRGLRALNGHALEPALIDPSLPVASSSVGFDQESIPYWPNYSEISSDARQSYLTWHTSGRSGSDAPISFVFLHFYGLERRLLSDLGADGCRGEEYGRILAEVRRLLGIYGVNNSFRRYASALVEFAEAVRLQFEDDAAPPEFVSTGYEFPARLRIALGMMSQEGKTIPASWARAWAIADPTFSRRTPFQRCGQYFASLFEARYRERFGNGVMVKPNKTLIRLEYQPASASFGGLVTFKRDLPDITVLKEPIGKLRSLAEECTNEMDAYSRYLGRNPGGEKDLAALALLPGPLLSAAQTGHARDLREKLEKRTGAGALLTRSELLLLAACTDMQTFTKRDAVVLAQILSAMGFGIEPDVRFGGALASRDTKIFVFPMGNKSANAPTPAYSAATLLLDLAAFVSAADGTVTQDEEEHLKSHIGAALQLTEDERLRLDAHLRWALAERPGLAGVKKRIEDLALSQRQAIGRFLVGVASSDGHISPVEVEMLGKIYRMLGLDPQDVYSHAHQAATEPVTVRPAEVGPAGLALPPRRRPAKTSGVRLDAAAIEAKLQETAAVSALLASVFVDETSPQIAPSIERGNVCIPGFDVEISDFVNLLATKAVWSRGELESMATERAILLDGTIEAINEAAFDHCDEPILEGEDPVEVNLTVLTTLLQRTVAA
jgi:uncharacterized tellurite resistance protein B-like protein